MIDKSKIIILVTGAIKEPWDKNWKECMSTWIPLVRQLGYSVKVALGDLEVEDFSDDGDIIRFHACDSKKGLVDKSLIYPMRWILNHTDYEYYIRIDSDSFVHPNRFDAMMEKNILEFEPDYMGTCIPYPGIDPNIPLTYYIEQTDSLTHFASGTAYMISRKVMQEVLDKIRVDDDWQHECDDWVLGRSMCENGINLLHDSSIYMESKWVQIIVNPYELKMPNIEEKDSHLAIQHYQNGHMAEIMLQLIS